MLLAKRLEQISVLESRADRAASLFLLPGQLFCDWLKVPDEESAFLLRVFVNLSIYGKVAILTMLPFIG